MEMQKGDGARLKGWSGRKMDIPIERKKHLSAYAFLVLR